MEILLPFLGLFSVGLVLAFAIPAALKSVMQTPRRASRDAYTACRQALCSPDLWVRHHPDGIGWTLQSGAGPRGLPVRIEYRSDARDSRPRTIHIRVELIGGLSADTTLRAGSGGPTLGDPILDGRIALSSSRYRPTRRESSLRFLQDRLQDPRHDLRGCLMDVLVGLPDTRVHDGGVEIEFVHDRRPLPELLERLAALAEALSDRPEPAPDPDAQPDAQPETDRDAARRSQAGARPQKA